MLKRGDILYSVRVEGRLFSAEARCRAAGAARSNRPWILGPSEVRLKRELQTLMPMFSEPWLFHGDAWYVCVCSCVSRHVPSNHEEAFEGEVQQTKQKAEHSAAQKALSALCSLQSAAERTAETKKMFPALRQVVVLAFASGCELQGYRARDAGEGCLTLPQTQLGPTP